MCILLLLRETNLLQISANDNKSVFSLCTCKITHQFKSACDIVVRSHVFSLHSSLKLLLLIALVAGETNIGLVIEITSENNPGCGLVRDFRKTIID